MKVFHKNKILFCRKFSLPLIHCQYTGPIPRLALSIKGKRITIACMQDQKTPQFQIVCASLLLLAKKYSRHLQNFLRIGSIIAFYQIFLSPINSVILMDNECSLTKGSRFNWKLQIRYMRNTNSTGPVARTYETTANINMRHETIRTLNSETQ